LRLRPLKVSILKSKFSMVPRPLVAKIPGAEHLGGLYLDLYLYLYLDLYLYLYLYLYFMLIAPNKIVVSFAACGLTGLLRGIACGR
jgi:hypothetical protein